MDGYLDDQTLPDTASGGWVRFQLVVSPTDDRIDQLVIPCTVTHLDLAHAVVNNLGASDLLRVRGRLQFPRQPGDGMRLLVSAIHVVEGGVDLGHVSSEDELGPEVLSAYGFIERYSDCQVWHDPDACLTSVWHASGEWVGSTDDPRALGDIIAAHQQRATSTPADTTHAESASVSPPAPSRRRLAGLHRMRNWLRRN